MGLISRYSFLNALHGFFKTALVFYEENNYRKNASYCKFERSDPDIETPFYRLTDASSSLHFTYIKKALAQYKVPFETTTQGDQSIITFSKKRS